MQLTPSLLRLWLNVKTEVQSTSTISFLAGFHFVDGCLLSYSNKFGYQNLGLRSKCILLFITSHDIEHEKLLEKSYIYFYLYKWTVFCWKGVSYIGWLI